MSGTRIQLPVNGREITAFLSTAQSLSSPSIVVVQEWWGLVPHIESICERLAEHGFNAMAPDLYHGESAASPDAARKLMMAMNIGDTEKDLSSTVDFLLSQPYTNGPKVGIIGFCMGGMLALYAACINPKIGACVDFYGVPHPKIDLRIETLQAPVLGFFGAEDHVVPLDSARDLERKLHALGKTAEFVVYENVGHAFSNDSRKEVYNQEAATDAWNKLLSFLHKNL